MQHNHNSRFEMFNILHQLLNTSQDHTDRVDGIEDAGGYKPFVLNYLATPHDEISNIHLMLPNGWQKWHLSKANDLNSILFNFNFNGFIKSE